MKNFDPAALECLAAIVEEGSFEAAAQRLSITQSAVSQRLRAFEAQTGVLLLVRSRPVRATPAGQLMLKHAKQLRLLRADLEHELRELSPGAGREHERISIAVNADSIATWALPALDAVVRSGVALELIADDQDFTDQWLREGQVLGCVTTLSKPLRGCSMTPLGRMHYVAVASHDFIARYLPGGLTRANFHDIPFVVFNRKDDMQREFVARAFKLRSVALQQVFVPSSEGVVRAAEMGWGVAVVPELQVRERLRHGVLVRLLPEVSLPITLYWHCWNMESTTLADITRALHDAAAGVLEPAG